MGGEAHPVGCPSVTLLAALLSEKWGPFLKNQQEFQVPAAELMTLALSGHRGGLLGAVMLEADFKG